MLVEAQVRNVSAEFEGFRAVSICRQQACHRGAHLWIVIDDRYNFVTVRHDIPKLRATTCHFDPHPEVGVDVPIGL